MPTHLMTVGEPDCEPVSVDMSDAEMLTIVQKDEGGVDHIVVLTPKMLKALLPELQLWLSISHPTSSVSALQLWEAVRLPSQTI